MRPGAGLLIATALMLAPDAAAQDQATERVECDVEWGDDLMRTPEDLNAVLFRQNLTLSGSWNLEEV